MLEHLPRSVGHALEGKRAGPETLFANLPDCAAPRTIAVESASFAEGGAIPVRHTADGPGTSPPLAWHGVHEGAAALVLAVEDADSPTAEPLIHAIVTGLSTAEAGTLPEGSLPGPDGRGAPDTGSVGRNSFLGRGWLPPDPPPGHGPHRYAFQLFALDHAPTDGSLGRAALMEVLRGHVIAQGVLTGTYERP